MVSSIVHCACSWTSCNSERFLYSSYKWISCIVLFTVLQCTVSQIVYRNCEPDPGLFAACFPSPENILMNGNSTITVDPADATCGLTGTEFYMRLGDAAEVKTCGGANQHTKDMMIDKFVTTTWWQSKTWSVNQYQSTGPKHEFPVTLTFSVHKKYRMSSNITLIFNSGPPRTMIIEKSADYGQTWEPLQYYSQDCGSEFPDAAKSYASNLTAVICTEGHIQDSSNPQPGSKVNFPGSSQRMLGYSSTQYYAKLEEQGMKQFMTFTDIRVRLLYPATDSKERSEQIRDFYRYYYAISDISIFGSCFCNLHGSGCISNLNRETVCDCSHNTEGMDCERCKPLYNNKPWREGSFLPSRQGSANACEKCVCNDHADSCTYNATLRYGTCDSCKHNTTGLQCEQCLDTFYPNTSVPLNDTKVCLACDCELLGLQDTADLVCQKDRSLLNIGQCRCKSLVTGRRCDRCMDTYYGLLLPESPGTCQECGCNQYGTVGQSRVCDVNTGQCPCKISIDGRTCNQCKRGYYRFPPLPSGECQSCGCDSGGSTNPVCDGFGMCTCISHVSSPKCTQVEQFFYIPPLDEFVKQPVGGSCTIDGDLWTVAKPFDGDGFATCSPTAASTVDFEPLSGTNQQFALSWPYFVSVRYSLNEIITRTGGSVVVTVTGNSNADVSSYTIDGQPPSPTCPFGFDTTYNIPVNFTNGNSTAVTGIPSVTLDKRCSYSVRLTIPAQENTTHPILIDSVVLLPSLSNQDTGAEFRTLSESRDRASNYPLCTGNLASLSTRSDAMSKSPCKELLWSVAAELYKEGKPCQCDPIGTSGDKCAGNGGQCTCKLGVGGRRCDVCLPGYYNLTATGCTRCPTQPCPVLPTTAPTTTLVPLIVTASSTTKSTIKIILPQATDVPKVESTTPTTTLPKQSTQSTTTDSTNGTTLETSKPETAPNLSGLFIGLGLGFAAIILVCIAIIVLCPKTKLRKFNCFQRSRNTENGESHRDIRVIHRGPGGNLGSHDPRNQSTQEEGDKKIAWMSPDANGRSSPFDETKVDLTDAYELPSFYLGQGVPPNIPKPEPVYTEVTPDVVDRSPKPKLKDLSQTSGERSIDCSRDFEVDIIPPPPSFNTFKSDNPITLPAITVTKAAPPKKPKRKKKPRNRSVKPVKLANNNPADTDSYNKSLDDNKHNENLLQTIQNQGYAGLDGFDEVNGSLV